VSIPFIFVAFNLKMVLKWTRRTVARAKKANLAMSLMATIILILVVALAVILSQPLEAGIKAGVGIGLGLLSAIALASLYIFHRLRRNARRA
jgi:hypothetical protein